MTSTPSNGEEINIGGVGVRPFRSLPDAAASIVDADGSIRPGFAIAINPEKIMAARRDPSIRRVLESGTRRYPDGIGVVWALRRRGEKSARIPGCELWEILMAKCAEHRLPIFLIGGKPETVARTCEKLCREHPGIAIVGVRDGYFGPEEETALCERIRSSGAKFVSVAMGSPRQELFIQRCQAHCPDTFFMGVGGTYDVYIGAVRRAPRPWRMAHLEWLYRLIKQPTRIGRQAVLAKFVLLEISGRL